MTRKENLLTILAEECVETAQRVSKALRFTLEEVQPDQELTNAQRIVYEFNDIVAVMEVLQEEGVFKKVIDREAIDKKKLKLATYFDHSVKVGTIDESIKEQVELIIDDYKRRLITISNMIDLKTNNGGINDQRKDERLRTKQSEYRSIISELERSILK